MDMIGNAWEWVEDWYDTNSYTDCSSVCSNPTGPLTGQQRVLRGGCYSTGYTYQLRASTRYLKTPTSWWYTVGFRCAVSSTELPDGGVDAGADASSDASLDSGIDAGLDGGKD
jgi:formylglycine-generating enzyme required for sulfatase activity